VPKRRWQFEKAYRIEAGRRQSDTGSRAGRMSGNERQQRCRKGRR